MTIGHAHSSRHDPSFSLSLMNTSTTCFLLASLAFNSFPFKDVGKRIMAFAKIPAYATSTSLLCFELQLGREHFLL